MSTEKSNGLEGSANKEEGPSLPPLKSRNNRRDSPPSSRNVGVDDLVEDVYSVPHGWRSGEARQGIAAASVVSIVLVLALVGAAWYAYPRFREYVSQLAQVPLLGGSIAQAVERLGNVERQLETWPERWKAMQEQMADLDRTLKDRFRLAQTETQSLIKGVQESLRREFSERERVLEARLNQLEENQESETTRVADLQHEVASLGIRMRSVQQEVAAGGEHTNQDLGDLKQRLARNEDQLEKVAGDIHRDRIDFEIARNATQEIAPGVLARISNTDVRYRQFSGWILLVPEGRTLWFRDQSVQQPVTFYRVSEQRPRELVITHISRESAAGYLLLPEEEATAARERATSGHYVARR